MSDHSDLIAVRCEGCGSAWTDADLARERAANPRLLSCCPERKPLTIDQWRARAEAQSLSLSEAREEIERLKGLVAGIRETPARTSLIRQETAAVFRGGGRRFFTRKAAERAEAKAAIRKRCECCDGDWETPPEVCTYHRDPERLQRTIHLLVVMFIRKEVRP